ncbi:MAG: lysine--tRNA ligase [Ignavibacteriae bacterium]|nr:lysine--tRNA ligase [Ignavibacteriota bacterium]MCB9244361.1 lysine--tRNA ligase [Ignavibacteriales bacterium]
MNEQNELIKRRIEELEHIKQLGVNPYPHKFDVTAKSADVISSYKDPADDDEKEKQKENIVSIAGRIMSIRKMGKASFCHIKDEQGRIQTYIKKDEVGDTCYELFKLLDIGDIIGVKGYPFRTKTGEVSIHAVEMEILTKTIHPLPVVKEETTESGEKIVHDAFADVELRYRQRYIDLIVNEHVRETFVKRTKIIQSIRKTLEDNNFMEVETPTLQVVYGGANAKPFVTHHNTLDMQLYLRISNELFLKRLIVGGFDRVYEFVKDFRNEGIDRTHNPEFTQVEWYQAYGDFNDSMELFEKVIENACLAVHDTTKVTYGDKVIDFKAPWRRVTMPEAIADTTGLDVLNMKRSEIIDFLNSKDIHIDKTIINNKGLLIALLFEEMCENDLTQPTFVTEHPIDTTPLCKPLRRYSMKDLEEMKDDPEEVIFVERFEPYINCWEMGNSYTELNDPILQRRLLEDQVERGRGGEEETHPLDEDFIKAIEVGMPPTTGVGLGVDRLVMLLTNSHSIRDVLFFPLMRPLKD